MRTEKEIEEEIKLLDQKNYESLFDHRIGETWKKALEWVLEI